MSLLVPAEYLIKVHLMGIGVDGLREDSAG